ncbi:hypothetical protein [Enterobacter kobei]|uniref:hypothetical protein n=1 Tax=Enterobacter kobei TaxID=208224 RepID=UPI0028741AA7|nr:hypothetical protein [Enterobacter kobei]MDS0023356.1 hypothetical protein [Enterobacter kobei]
MNIFQHGIKKTFSIAALLCASVSSACYAAETVSTNQTMWDEWKNNPGFTEALDELGKVRISHQTQKNAYVSD